MTDTTLTAPDGTEIFVSIDDESRVHVYKHGIEIGSVSTAQEVITAPAEPVEPPRFGESSFNEPFVPDEETDEETEESTDA